MKGKENIKKKTIRVRETIPLSKHHPQPLSYNRTQTIIKQKFYKEKQKSKLNVKTIEEDEQNYEFFF